jgi:hypothetical protein
MPGMPGRFGGIDGYAQPVPAAAPVTQPISGKGGLPTVIKEQLLRITMEVEIVKLLPKA